MARILVANRAGGRIFQSEGPGRKLRLVQAIAHPRGPAGGGYAQTSTCDVHQHAADHLADVFAHELSGVWTLSSR